MANAFLVVLEPVLESALGLGIALAGPRFRRVLLTSFTLPLVLGLAVALLFAGTLSIGAVALLIPAMLAAAVLLPQVWPRGALFLLLLAAVRSSCSPGRRAARGGRCGWRRCSRA